ncbi:voltage-dependent calcium channel gamma-5 subunit-like [Apostichopus japonicus]|uniref:voltage-dependent calcium channel gamma-5 subunit-like n=1 Tax=Stichopus japonicus TaxID=307972 RepID=UPI003AB90160
MCDAMYTARKFRVLCGISVLLGFFGWVFITVSVSTNQWVIAEGTMATLNTTKDGENISRTYFLRTSTGIWDICFESYLLTEDGEQQSEKPNCVEIEFLIRNITTDEWLLSYFKSLMAFELISVFAVFIGTVVASVAMVQQHPLVVLVAGFTMIFSGLFMLVGHVMMIHTHTSSEEDQSVRETDHYRYFIGWSFVCGWFAFAFCLLSGGILLELYRVCRKYIDEYGNHNPSRVNKKIQRSRPVNVGSSI